MLIILLYQDYHFEQDKDDEVELLGLWHEHGRLVAGPWSWQYCIWSSNT